MTKTKIILPVRVAAGYVLKIRGPGDADGGWSTVECRSVAEARQIMADHPAAEMPAWRNPAAPWNR
jgi:hypothetical protein